MAFKPRSEKPRDRLIEAASDLFCQHGINAIGVDAVVERAGTAKTTLYKIFGSKDALVEAVLLVEGQAWRDWFIKTTLGAGSTPRDRLDSIFPVLAVWFGEKRFYGCPFINAVAEHDKDNDRLRTIALGHKIQVLEHVHALCVACGVSQPDRLTHQIALLMDGAIVTAMITRSPACADIAQATLSSLLAQEAALAR